MYLQNPYNANMDMNTVVTQAGNDSIVKNNNVFSVWTGTEWFGFLNSIERGKACNFKNIGDEFVLTYSSRSTK